MAIYEVTKNWPCEEQFGGLTSQLRKAALSTIPSNSAEGPPTISRWPTAPSARWKPN